MLQAAKRAGAAATGGSSGRDTHTTPTSKPDDLRRLLCCQLSRAEFTAASTVSSQAVMVGSGAARSLALVATVVPLQQAPLTVLLVRSWLRSHHVR